MFAQGCDIVSTRDLSAQLNRIVEKAIEDQQLAKFQEYWELYEATIHVTEVQAFFVRSEVQESAVTPNRGGYCNVAIIADGLLIDIEADDSDNSGSLTVQSLKSVSDISIHKGSLKNLSSSRGASLVVLANRIGEEDIGLHWAAKTAEEEEHLLQFAEALVQAISKA